MNLITLIFSIKFLLIFQFIDSKFLLNNFNNNQELIKSLQLNEYLKQLQLLLNEIKFLTKIHKCYTIITDNIHSDLLTKEFFLNNNYSNIKQLILKLNLNFIIRIDDNFNDNDGNSNLSSSSLKILKVLQQIKYYNCDLLFLLIWNGKNMRNLLKFLDKNRLFNTNMKFVVLYHDEIFELENIWKKIINIICIREREKIRNGKKFKM